MKMKQTALVLMCFIGCTTLLWAQSEVTEIRLVPFTLEHNNLMQNISPEKLKELEFYLSNNASVIPRQNNVSAKADVVNGTLTPINEQSAPAGEMVFNTVEKGTLNNREPASASIVIDFKSESGEIVPLRFRRNSQGRYALVSAQIGLENNTLNVLSEGGRPVYLLVKYDDSGLNNRVEMEAVRDSAFGGGRRTSPQPDYRDRQPRDGGGQSYQTLNTGGSAGWQQASRNIIARGSVTERGIAAYARSQNPSVNTGTLNRLIGIYFREAENEGVNSDIAIAQMLYATNYLRNQRVTAHNYGGLSPTPGWNGRFPHYLNDGMTEGVRAHIQHLKGYASRAPLQNRNVDPRYDILAGLGYLGSARIFDDLYRLWSENPNYGNEIERILNGLYRLSGF
jgi:hypothetical protein